MREMLAQICAQYAQRIEKAGLGTETTVSRYNQEFARFEECTQRANQLCEYMNRVSLMAKQPNGVMLMPGADGITYEMVSFIGS